VDAESGGELLSIHQPTLLGRDHHHEAPKSVQVVEPQNPPDVLLEIARADLLQTQELLFPFPARDDRGIAAAGDVFLELTVQVVEVDPDVASVDATRDVRKVLRVQELREGERPGPEILRASRQGLAGLRPQVERGGAGQQEPDQAPSSGPTGYRRNKHLQAVIHEVR